jgi:hypothetical protein
MTRSGHDPSKRSALPAGHDEEDPYENEDLEGYPEWWRRNIEEFREYGLRPYRPPRFADGVLVPPFISELEEETNEEIHLRTLQPMDEGAWEVLLGLERVTTVDRYRHTDGYSVYEIESKSLGQLVRESADS